MLAAVLGANVGHIVAAGLTVVLAVAAIVLVERAFASRSRRLAATLGVGGLSPVADTRLRFLRRVIEATIVFVGVLIVLRQFDQLDRLAGSLLASSAITAAVIGFAARPTLGNAIAGLLLAVTQPLRIGDRVEFAGETGVVDDVRLTYTFLRTADGSRVVIPNEMLASSVLRNDTVLEPSAAAEVSLGLTPATDALAALAALRDALPSATVTLDDVTADATVLKIRGEPGDPDTKGEREAALRADAYGALHERGLR